MLISTLIIGAVSSVTLIAAVPTPLQHNEISSYRNGTNSLTFDRNYFEVKIDEGLEFLRTSGIDDSYELQSVFFDTLPMKKTYMNSLEDIDVITIAVRNSQKDVKQVVSIDGGFFKGPNIGQDWGVNTFDYKTVKRSIASAWSYVRSNGAEEPFVNIQLLGPVPNRGSAMRPPSGPWYCFTNPMHEVWYVNAIDGRTERLKARPSIKSNVTEA